MVTRGPGIGSNFAANLCARCTDASLLVDAGGPGAGTAARQGILAAGAAFAAAGLRPGDAMLFLCDLSPATALAYLGALHAGVVPVMLEPEAAASAGGELVRATRARATWRPRATVGLPPEAADLPGLVGPLDGAPGAAAPPAPRGADDLAVLMPTSGSTGLPRLVQVTHGNLLANTEAIARSQRLGAGDRAVLVLPLSYCFGTSVLHSHLWAGGGVVFDRRIMFVDKVLLAARDLGCTTFAGVPSVYKLLLRHRSLERIHLPALKRFLQAGGPLEGDSIRAVRAAAPDADFFVMYGQTEATARLTTLPPERLADKLGSVGLPLDDLELRVADERGEPLPPGVQGEIRARGPSITPGYFGDPEGTAEILEGGWLRTGDLGHVDEDGFFWIDGRKGEFVKVRGTRLSFGEIEARVRGLATVRDAGACRLPHAEAGEAIGLLVVPEDGAVPRDLETEVRAALPPAWTCAAVLVVDELPRTPRGKLDRNAFVRRIESSHAPRTR